MTRTGVFCVATAMTVAIYDAIAVAYGGVDASVSRYLQDTAFASPAFTFSMGFIAGHIFGYMRPSKKWEKDDK